MLPEVLKVVPQLLADEAKWQNRAAALAALAAVYGGAFLLPNRMLCSEDATQALNLTLALLLNVPLEANPNPNPNSNSNSPPLKG